MEGNGEFDFERFIMIFGRNYCGFLEEFLRHFGEIGLVLGK